MKGGTPVTFDPATSILPRSMIAHLRSLILAPASLALLLTSCGGAGKEGESQETDSLATDVTPKETEVIGVAGQLFSVPSPAQAAMAIKQAGLKYQQALTAPLDKGEARASRMAQATMLGIYGADLSYATVHKDGKRVLTTLEAIEKLAAKLEISNAFDRSLMERFKSNMGSEDSLLRFSGVAFRAADQYLKTNEAEDVSAWLLTGGWVESMHLMLADPATAQNQTLIARVGEQKKTVEGLTALLSATNKEGQSDALLAALKELGSSMQALKTAYAFEPAVTDAAKKTTYINSRTSVEATPEQIAEIAAKVTAVRNLILA